jgi:hypothetical protein
MPVTNKLSARRKNRIAHVLLAGSIAGLAACGGDSSSSGSNTGTFSLAVTDAPVDSATQVVIEFTGVSIKPADGEAIAFSFDQPKSINMLDLQGSLSAGLITEEVAAGAYEWMRLDVNAEQDGVMDSFIEFNDGTQAELRIPSGSQTGLKLVRGFTVPVGGNADFTVDFDLRKSLTNPRGQASVIFKPTLRLVDNVTVGSVTGTIDSSLVSTQCADASLDDGAVYVYSGADATPTDVQGAETDPLITALVNVVDSEYSYEVGFLSEGTYTISYTCDAGADAPEVADELVFSGTTNVTVSADTVTTHNFVAQ